MQPEGLTAPGQFQLQALAQLAQQRTPGDEAGDALARFAEGDRARLLDVELGQPHHRVTFELAGQQRTVTAGWVTDATGRASILAKTGAPTMRDLAARFREPARGRTGADEAPTVS